MSGVKSSDMKQLFHLFVSFISVVDSECGKEREKSEVER